jgi:FkbH-like protein
MSHRVVIASTFASEPLPPVLSYWFDIHGLDVELTLAPYGQVLEQVAPGGELDTSDVDLGVLLIRPEDYLRDDEGQLCTQEVVTARAMRNVEELCAALDEGAAIHGRSTLIGVMPGTGDPAIADFAGPARSLLRECAESHQSISWLDVDGALELYEVRRVGDPQRDALAHIPFAEECLAAVATAIARRLRAVWGPPCKVIALDCDNTLWSGACSEDPIDELDASGPFEYLRAFMREQSKAGRLLCLVSRNPEGDVERAFSRHGAPLLDADIAARRCGWDAKADSLRSIAAELDLGVESFALVDDDPLECALVREQLPQLPVVQLPRRPQDIPRALKQAWELDLPDVTEADHRRAGSYAANKLLRAQRAVAPDFERFVEALDVQVAVSRLQPDEVARAVQLFQRTNQFNSTGERVSAGELRLMMKTGEPGVWVARVSDRLGEYGIVAVLVAAAESTMLRFERIALSCRVFQRRVEHTMLSELARLLDWQGARFQIAYRDTGRNVPVRRFLEELAATEVAPDEGGVRWFEASIAALRPS